MFNKIEAYKKLKEDAISIANSIRYNDHTDDDSCDTYTVLTDWGYCAKVDRTTLEANDDYINSPLIIKNGEKKMSK